MQRAVVAVAFLVVAGAPALGSPLPAQTWSAAGLQAAAPLDHWFLEAPAGLRLRMAGVEMTEFAWHSVTPAEGGADRVLLQPGVPQGRWSFGRLDAAAWMAPAALSVIPVEGRGAPIATWEAPAAAFGVRHGACERNPLPYHEATDRCFDRVGTAGVVHEATVTLRLTGSFVVELHGWNGTLAHSDGAHTWWTGSVQEDMAPGLRLQETRMSELRVIDGWIELALPPGIEGPAFRHVDMDAKGGIEAGGVRLDGPAVAVARVVGGQAFVETSPPPRPLAATWAAEPWFWVGAVAVAAAAIVATIYLYWRPRDPVLRAMHSGRLAKAVRLAVEGRPARTPEEAIVRAMVLMQGGHLERAERQLHVQALPDADRLFVLACIRARQGRDAEASALLQECVQLNPAYLGEVPFHDGLQRAMATLR